MDREIEVSVRRKAVIRRVAITLAVAAVAWAALAASLGLLRPAAHRDRIRTAKVHTTDLTATIEATGTVVPAFEKVLSSPVEARILRVLQRPGAELKKGDEILLLDTSGAALDLQRLEDRIAQKQSEKAQAVLQAEESSVDLRTRLDQKRLDGEVLRYREQQYRKLLDEGLVSEEAYRQAEVEAKKALLEISQLEQRVASGEKTSRAKLQGFDLELRSLAAERAQAARQLELATARADHDGVLTWVADEEGSTLARGEIFARIADLRAYGVEATVSDVHAGNLRSGMPVEVIAGTTVLPGTIHSIHPAIENGTVRFEVRLENPSSELLRNNLRVDVHVITGSKTGVLALRKGSYGTGGQEQQLFVIRGDEAVRTPVRLGLFGREEVEVVSGLAEGDEVIISDTSQWRHAGTVRVK